MARELAEAKPPMSNAIRAPIAISPMEMSSGVQTLSKFIAVVPEVF